MSVPLKYIGASQRYFDTVDGSRAQWTSGDTFDVADSAAVGLIATGYFGPVEGAALNAYTAAQLSAMAAAGTLTPYETYVPSDASPAYQLWARSATELVSPSGASLIPVSYPGAVGSLVEV